MLLFFESEPVIIIIFFFLLKEDHNITIDTFKKHFGATTFFP